MDTEEWDENLLATVCLGKTVAFLLYSLLVPLVSILFLEVFPLLYPPLLRLFLGVFPQQYLSALSYVLFIAGEAALFALVYRGWLPGTRPEWVLPFSETQLGWGAATLSVVPWVLRYDPVRFEIFQWVLNGSLLFFIVIFFLTKSVLSRKIRWEVLRVLAVPVLQILLVSGLLSH